MSYSDYRQVDGLRWPFRRQASFNGEPFAARGFVAETVTINPELPADLFEPPPPEPPAPDPAPEPSP